MLNIDKHIQQYKEYTPQMHTHKNSICSRSKSPNQNALGLGPTQQVHPKLSCRLTSQILYVFILFFIKIYM